MNWSTNLKLLYEQEIDVALLIKEHELCFICICIKAYANWRSVETVQQRLRACAILSAKSARLFL